MTPGAIPLDYWDLAIAAALVLVAGGVNVALRLGLEKKLLVASVRTIAQLIAIGYVLEWVFAIDNAPAVMGILAVMIVVAGKAAVDRSKRRFQGATLRALAALSASSILATFTVTGAIVGVSPWYDAQYVIPLMGMVLGNSLTGISLCLDRLLAHLAERRPEVEAALAHGATSWEASRGMVADAVRTGMIPILNSMTVVGLVSLPGMMTGQILAGADPLIAVKYQIVVMFMLCAATALGAIGVAFLVQRRLFDERHCLRSDLIKK